MIVEFIPGWFNDNPGVDKLGFNFLNFKLAIAAALTIVGEAALLLEVESFTTFSVKILK